MRIEQISQCDTSIGGNDVLLSDRIIRVLRQIGLNRRYKGCIRLVCSVQLIIEDEKRLEAIVKEVYMPAGKILNCSWGAVERSIRVAGTHIWIYNYNELCKIAGCSLKYPPTPADLIDIIATYVKYST
jgi:hypothetical protein